MQTDDMIERLAREAAIVRSLPAPRTRIVVWLIWGAIYVVVAAITTLRMMSSSAVTMTPLYVFQQGAALVTGITAARAAFISVIPGANDRARALPIISAAVWVASLLWQGLLDVQASGTLGAGRETDWPCVASMALGAAVLGGPLLWMLRRGAPLTPRVTAFLAGLAALSVANIEACLTRPHAFAVTVLLWHGGTVVVAAAVFAGMGRRWLRWPEMRRA